mmetsp:Transcript_68809/g.119477  ORF Transcript_68809/g.119477 Transcript_68809/m.119477 type:complete len:200 (-) Transcript_68809:123-722(-)
MSVCRIVDVKLQQPIAPVLEDLSFEITLDVAEPLSEDLVFRCLFVVDASKQSASDVELDCIDVGNPGLSKGIMKFVFQCAAPSKGDIIASGCLERGEEGFDISGIYLSALYRDQEFCRVGYYLVVEYDDPKLQDDPPADTDWNRLQRKLSTPSVTLFSIAWDPRTDAQGGNAEQLEAPPTDTPAIIGDEGGANKRPRVI